MITRQFLKISYILAGTAALVLALGMAHAANAARHVRPAVTVEGPVVTLGDLFAHEPDAGWAGVAVADAPPPGETGRIRTTDVMVAARRAGVVWDQDTAPHTITVTRASHVLSLDSLTDILADALPPVVAGGNWEIQLNNRHKTIALPVGFTAADVKVQRFYYDDRYASFNATLVIPDANGRRHEETVTGRLVEMAYIPVLSESVAAGEVIRKRHVQWIKVAARKVTRNVVASTDDLIGKAARRSLRAGVPLRPSDVQTPILVEKGALVTMTVATESMTLTATGRALEDGGEGDVIRLVNVSTHSTIEGVVVSPRQVVIHSNSRVASLR